MTINTANDKRHADNSGMAFAAFNRYLLLPEQYHPGTGPDKRPVFTPAGSR